MGFEITEVHGDDGSLEAEVRRGIQEADPADVGARVYRPLTLAMRNADGALIGGVYGATMWRWLMLDGLWITVELRGQGLGTRLLNAAEAAAKERDCLGVSLGTFDFQAKSFYERHGYAVFGQLTGFPPGHTHFQLAKRFD